MDWVTDFQKKCLLHTSKSKFSLSSACFLPTKAALWAEAWDASRALCFSRPGLCARQPFDFSSYVSWDFVVSVVVLLQFVLGQWPLSTVPALEVTSLTFQAEQQIELYKLTPVRDSVILNSSGNHILGCRYLVRELLTCGTLSNHSKEANCIK